LEKRTAPSDWVETQAMADALGCHRKTLSRLKCAGYFNEGTHYRKKNPLSPRGVFVWHKARVLIKTGAA
jgi:hypothetical protein